MNLEDKDALVGRILRLRKEAKEHLGLLMAQAQNKGDSLKSLGHRLAAYPAHLVKTGTNAEERFRSEPYASQWQPSDLMSADEVRQLTEEIRTTLVKLTALEAQLKNIGHEV